MKCPLHICYYQPYTHSLKIFFSAFILSHSGPNSFIFVNLVDHGAPGIFAFPEEYVSSCYGCHCVNPRSSQMHAKQLIKVIEAMHSKQKYDQMVFYVESCESGSLFDGLLSPHVSGMSLNNQDAL